MSLLQSNSAPAASSPSSRRKAARYGVATALAAGAFAALAAAVSGVLSLDLPPEWYLAGCLALWLIYGAPGTGKAPLYCSHAAVAAAVAAVAPQGGRVVDLGCGLGGPLARLAHARPDLELHGIESALLPWLVSKLRGLRHRGFTVTRGDFWRADLRGFDLVYAFLSPLVMERLWDKARREMRPGTVLVSYRFTVPGVAPDRTVTVDAAARGELHFWRIRSLPDLPRTNS